MPKIHPILTSSFLLLALILGLVLAVFQGWVSVGPIYLEAQLKETQRQGDALFLPVQLILKNPSWRIQKISPQNSCKIFRWLVLDQHSAFVQAFRKETQCKTVMIVRALRPREKAQETIILRLDKKRFKPNQPYILILEFWGLEQQLSFIPAI